MNRKLTLLTITIVSISVNINAMTQSDTITYWDYTSRVFHGTTNEVCGIQADTKGNVYYSGYGYEIGSAKKHAFISGKMNDTLAYVWKKEYFDTPTGGVHQVLVDSSSVYIVGQFINSLTFPPNTFTTASSNNSETFFICLDANNGNLKWSRNLGRIEGTTLFFDGNSDLVLAYAAVNGDQIYDGVTLQTLNISGTFSRGYAYLTLNKADGTVKNYSFGINNILSSQTVNQLVNREIKSFVSVTTYVGWTPKQAYRVRTLDLNTNTVTTSTESIEIKSKNTYFDILNTPYHPKDKSWTVFLKYNNDTEIYIGNDTVKRPTIGQVYKFNVAVRLDSTLKMINHLNYNNTLDYSYQIAQDSTLAFSFGAVGDGYVERNGIMDTIAFKGGVSQYQKGYFVAKTDLNFDNITFNRYSVYDDTAGWQTGIIFKGLDIDSLGNIYAAAFHENNIVALPDTIKAYNKSWRHLSIISKSGNKKGQHTSVRENRLNGNNLSISTYPNPTDGTFYIKGLEANARANVEVMDIQGRLIYRVLDYATDTPVTLTLKEGIYFLRVNTNGRTMTSKFVVR